MIPNESSSNYTALFYSFIEQEPVTHPKYKCVDVERSKRVYAMWWSDGVVSVKEASLTQ